MRSYISLLVESLKINIIRGTYFRISYYLQIAASLAYVLSMVFFWQFILAKVPQFAGWDSASIFLFLAFGELFFGINMAFLSISGKLWYFIRMGFLDNYLVKPLDPRISIMMDFFESPLFFKSLPGVFLFLFMAFQAGWRPAWDSMIMAVQIVVFATFLFALIQMTFSNIAFWIGSTQALDETLNSLYEFSHYPLDIMPNGVKQLFLYVLPLAFIATVPAQLASGQMSFGVGIKNNIILCLIILIWLIINEIAWRAGLRRYESYGG
ncbi:MAG: ABC-2 family transporter protein [Anaerolineaceae bacterium]|nr:ABC-2 family transporter protein [Anaerolineaceae bacterium]